MLVGQHFLIITLACLFACFFFFLLEIFDNTSAVLRDCVDAMSTFTSIKSYFCELAFVINTAFYYMTGTAPCALSLQNY